TDTWARHDTGNGCGMDLSVVIPASEEERRIGTTLERIVDYLHRRGGTSEILVVADGCRDRTVDVVRGIGTEGLPLRVLDSGVNRGKGRCVRRGMHAPRGTLRRFSDADSSTPSRRRQGLASALHPAPA